jgi:hypothetical protein
MTDPKARGRVVQDAHRGERIRALEDHADAAPDVDGIDVGCIDVHSIE